jgi:hypothetical protein
LTIPFVIDNQEHRLATVLNGLLAQTAGKPRDARTTAGGHAMMRCNNPV